MSWSSGVRMIKHLSSDRMLSDSKMRLIPRSGQAPPLLTPDPRPL